MNLSEYIIDFTIPQGPTGPTGPSDNFTRAFGYLCNQEKLILCLSGNPFAAAATFELLGRPVINFMGGIIPSFPAQCNAVLCSSFSKDSKIRRFVRAYLSGGKVSIPDACHSSGALRSFADCNCLIDIPAGSPPLHPGETVRVILL